MLDKEPTLEEISEYLNITLEEIIKLNKLLEEPVSINTNLDEEEHRKTEFQDQIASPDATPEELIEKSMLPDEIQELFKLCKLKPKEIDILTKRLGLNGQKKQTLEEIGEEYHVTREWVRQIEATAIKKIRNSKHCEEYLEYTSNTQQAKEKLEEYRKKYKENPLSKSSFLRERKSNEKKEKEKMPKSKKLYELLQPYTKEEIDIMLTKLTESEKELLKVRFPDGLSSTTSSKLTPEQKNKYYAYLVPKMRRLLANPHLIPGKRGRKKKIVIESVIPNIEEKEEEQIKTLPVESKEVEEKESQKIEKVEIEEELTKNQEKQEVQKVEISKEELKKEDYISILEILKTKTFGQMLNTLQVKEAIIISLRLGYVDGKYFSTESIANFLGITEIEVIETTKKVLLLYKEEINKYIDAAVEYMTETEKEKQLTKIN